MSFIGFVIYSFVIGNFKEDLENFRIPYMIIVSFSSICAMKMNAHLQFFFYQYLYEFSIDQYSFFDLFVVILVDNRHS